MLGAISGNVDFDRLLRGIRVFLEGFLNFTSGDDVYSLYVLGETIEIIRMRVFIQEVLPIALGLLGVIIGIKVAIRLFKRYSR